MDFEFSDEQREIRDQVRRLLVEQCDLKRVRHVLEGEAPYDKALWKQMGELGYLGVAIPEQYGGLGLGAATLCVDDGGPGIPVEERERVFDRFYRRTTEDESGTGLGLAIVRSVAAAHGATVSLHESPLGGLRATVRFG